MTVEFPVAVNLRVVKAEPWLKGDTSGAATKPVTLETGLVVQVPLFVEEGDQIKVDTRTGRYSRGFEAMPKGLSSRSKQRRYALRVLFEMDINWISIGRGARGQEQGRRGSSRGICPMPLFAGSRSNGLGLDRIISGYAEGWDLERMPLVDRNILRMSLYETVLHGGYPLGGHYRRGGRACEVFLDRGFGEVRKRGAWTRQP